MMETETRYAYCSACDQKVPVVLREGGSPDNPGDLLCLAHGETCTGDMCPLFDVPPEEMKRKLDESGLEPRRGRRPSRH